MSIQKMYHNDGLSDADRNSTALAGLSFKIHDLSTLELIACSRLYGKLIHYFNNENRPDGTWCDLFNSDEIGIIADIMNFSCKNSINNMNYQLRVSGGTTAVTSDCINKSFAIISNIDKWLKQLSQIDRYVARQFSRQIIQLIESDFIQYYKVMLSIMKAIAGKNVKVSLPDLYGPWKKVIYTAVEVCKPDEIQGKLSTILYALYGVITSIKKYAEMFYIDSLNQSDHSPETSLFFTFLELFRKVQAHLNTIPEKYVLFYYEKILQFTRKGAVSDTVYVTLDCTSKNAIIIPDGAEFTAESDGRTILYENIKAAVVKPLSVESVCTLFLEKNRFKEPERSLGFYTKVLSSEKIIDNKLTNLHQLTQEGKKGNEGTLKGSIAMGFAIASKILFLSEGKRTIKCTFSIDNDITAIWDKDFKKKLLKLCDYADDENTWNHVFIKIFKSLFTIELTSEKGWYTVEMYQPNASIIDTSCPDNTIQFEFTLPVNAPPIISYNKSVHGYSFTSNLPICKMTFNDNAEMFPYSFLENIEASDVHIDVSVEGATGLLLYNQFGPIESSTPFAPFGPVPAKGENFIIGYHELSSKFVQSIDLEIEWGNVPWQQNGFSEIYEGYSYPFSNNSFKVKISELRDGVWADLDDEEKRSITLYKTDSSSPESDHGIGTVLPETTITKIKLTSFREKVLPENEQNFQYTNKSKNRFVRLTLIAPECGFGHSLYANDLSSAFIKKVNSKNGVKLPSQPYYPTINTLKMNYRAKTVLHFSKSESDQAQSELLDSFYHVLPFGINRVCPGSGCSNVGLIPLIDKVENKKHLSENVLIGIKGEHIAGELSLYFHVNEEISSLNPADISWFVLSNNKWIQLDNKKIMSDTTFELSTSGTITFNIPEEITSNNTIMQQGLFWLRGAVESDDDCFMAIQSIHTNGIKLKRKQEQKDEDMSVFIKENCIKGLTRQITGINNVVQQSVSTGGIKKETTPAFITRISETLRHKNRLVATLDYEQIILEHFKEIYKVKCFRNFLSCDPFKNVPGNIVLCIIPALKESELIENQCPKVPAHKLNEIKRFLQKYISPMVTLEVINPVYEQIQIRCSIEPESTIQYGSVVANVNKQISYFISPWNVTGNKNCFGWRIVLNEVRQFISQIPGVKRVTNFSALYKTSPELYKYNLSDTAEVYLSGNNQNSIESKIPWSVCVPFNRHAIELIDRTTSGKGEIAGISKMDVANIFIIKGKNNGDTEQKNT